MSNVHIPRFDLQLQDKQARLQRVKAASGVSGTATLVTLAGNIKSTSNVAEGVALSASTTAVGTWEMAQGDGVTTSTLSDQGAPLSRDLSIVLDPSTDVRARIRDVSDSGCSMSVVFEYLLVDV